MRVLIAGAHTAIAKALEETLEERGVEVQLERASTREHLEEGHALLEPALLPAIDLVVLTFAGDAAAVFAEAARAAAKPVLDVAEALAEHKRARWIFPGIDPDAGRAFDPTAPAVIPVGLGAPIVAVLRALAPLEPSRATIATYESAAVADQPGMDELADQVRARFNMRDVEPRVFAAPLAFGCIPVAGPKGTRPEDADDRLRIAIEAGIEAELPDLELMITRVLVPTFSADGAVVVVETAEPADRARVVAALEGARGIHYLGDALPSSLEAVGRDDAVCGRLALDGDCISLWIASDRLRRGSATLAALAIERWRG